MTLARRTVAAVALTAVVVLPPVYYRVGWDRMEQACGADPPGAPGWRSVAFDWSWAPPGFSCTYDTGVRRTSLWFRT